MDNKGRVILKNKNKAKVKANKKSTMDCSSKYPAASTLLEVSMDEYAKERERTNTIENKANVFISVIIALFTIYIPIIPFSKLLTAYSTFSKTGIACVTAALCVMILSVVFLIIAFVNLYKGYKIKPYLRVEFSSLNDENILVQSENNVKRALIDHYNTILIGNSKINSEKADAVSVGIKYSIIAFALLSLSAIALIIMLGGIGNV